MKSEIFTCDIKNCKNVASHKEKPMQVIFTTEQTEGRSVTPHLSNVTIDLCDEHMNKLVEESKYIRASGAMGHNDYQL